MSNLDLEIRGYILDLMCHFETTLEETSINSYVFSEIKTKLIPMIEDGLVDIVQNKVRVTEAGIPFVRNCCMAFDQDLTSDLKKEAMFSKTI